jgi:UDPglucose--hexose-1-phosphate uridylyltransferase
VLKAVLQRMDKVLLQPPFNLIVHSSPFVDGTADLYHWHLEIIPKLTKVAGFEWGTGFYINPTGPEEAAQVLRDARV